MAQSEGCFDRARRFIARIFRRRRYRRISDEEEEELPDEPVKKNEEEEEWEPLPDEWEPKRPPPAEPKLKLLPPPKLLPLPKLLPPPPEPELKLEPLLGEGGKRRRPLEEEEPLEEPEPEKRRRPLEEEEPRRLEDDQEDEDQEEDDSYQKHDTVYSSTQSNVIKENPCAAQSMSESTDKQFNYQSLSEDKFEGVHVAGRKLFKIQNHLPQLLNWEEYGLRITVPERAVPTSETTEVAITALVGGEFILPEDSELVSAVYTISVSKPLLKPVRLEIQHCVSIETHSHANYLSFVTSSSNNCPFQFQSVNEGSFPVGGWYGSILISEFSSWAIIQTIKGWLKKLRHSSQLYIAQPLYENKRLGREWGLVFLFGKDLNAIKMHMKNEFKRSKSDKELSFQFESSDGCIEIHTDTENCSEGWSIRPHQENPTKVSRSTIDEYRRMDPPCFPQCRFTITATPGINTNPELEHPVTFKGIISDNLVFNIVLSMDQQSPKEIFKRKYYDALSDQMTPPDIEAIADDIYSLELITPETHEACMANSTTDRGHTLLDALTVIIDQPGVLTALIDVLKKFPAFKPIARKMEHELISVT